MRSSGLVKKILILALILALPGFLYYLLMVKGKNRYHNLSVFGPKQLAQTWRTVNGKSIPDTLYHTLPDFKLTNQDGKAVTLKTLDDKIFIADFFYTGCPTVCNEVNRNMSTIATAYANNKMLALVSITVDPQRDQVSVLKKYAGTFKASAPQWLFLTGDTAVIYPLARKGFLVNAVQVNNTDFIYSDKIILIDKHKRIRGYYSGTLPDDVQRLNDEIKVLITEELRDSGGALY